MLQDRAMLVSLKLHSWTGTRQNRELGDEVSEQKKAENGSVTAVINMIPQRYIKPIKRIDSRLRASHHYLTLPWTDEGARILPAALFFDHSKAIGGLLDERRAAIEEFCRFYPAIKEDAKRTLGELYDEELWPSNVRARFHSAINHFPIPSGEDFRVRLAQADTDAIRENIETTVRGQIHDAMGSVRLRVQNVLSDFIDRVKDYKVVETDEGKKVEGIFRDSIIDQMDRLADILPKLNLTGDPAIDEAAREIKAKITNHSGDAIRESDALRQNVLDQANKMLAKLGIKR